MTQVSSASTGTAPRYGALLTTVFVVQFLVALDVALLNVALPDISADLGLTGTGLQWVVNAYLLTFAGFMLLGGRLGDLVGRRTTLLVGLVLFTLASVVGAVATDAATLVGARAGQGLAGALVAPQSLALITSSIPEGRLRTRAMALWGAAGAGGGAVGVVLSGVLTQAWGWRAVLAVNVPIALLAVVATLRGVPRHERGVHAGRLDVAGAVLVTTGIAALVYAVSVGGEVGWSSAQVLCPLGGAVLLVAAFVVVESRVEQPLVPLRLFRVRSIVGANTLGFLLSAGQLAAFYFCSLFIQQVWGIEAALAGLLFLPFSAFVVLGIVVAQRVARRWDARTALLVHGLVGALGLAWFSQMPAETALWQGVVGPSLLAAVGIGGCMVVLAAAATTGVAPHDAGVASGVLNSSRQLGGTIGLAVLVAVATRVTTESVAGGHAMAVALGDGYRAGLALGAALLAVGAVLAYVVIPRAGRAA